MAWRSGPRRGDALPLVQIVRRDHHGDDVAGKDTDKVLAHFARDVRGGLVPIVEFDAELGIGKRLCIALP